MKPRFTADEAVAIIKTARGKNCKRKRNAKLRAAVKMARACVRAKTPMEKKAFPIGLLATLASFSPEILKALKWGGRGLGLLKKLTPVAKGVKTVQGLTGAQRLGGGIYSGLGAAGGGLGKMLSGAGGTGKLGQGARWLGGKISPWAARMEQGGQQMSRLASDPKLVSTLRSMGSLGSSMPRGLETVGQIARGAGPAAMGLGALMGTGGGDEMPQWANDAGPRLGGGMGMGRGMGNRLPPQLQSYLMGM